jgi:hypothetical protein
MAATFTLVLSFLAVFLPALALLVAGLAELASSRPAPAGAVNRRPR